MDKIEFLVLRNLLHNEEYLRKVIPFIKAEYFQDTNQKVVFEGVYEQKYEFHVIPAINFNPLFQDSPV